MRITGSELHEGESAGKASGDLAYPSAEQATDSVGHLKAVRATGKVSSIHFVSAQVFQALKSHYPSAEAASGPMIDNTSASRKTTGSSKSWCAARRRATRCAVRLGRL
jgi:hypothetical protein